MTLIDEMVIDTGPLTSIEIMATGLREIAQNVRTILATIRGTVFLDRTFGVDPSIIDLPTPAAKAKYINDVIAEVEKQEPRVQVISVEFLPPEPIMDAADGKVVPRVTIRVREGVLL